MGGDSLEISREQANKASGSNELHAGDSANLSENGKWNTTVPWVKAVTVETIMKLGTSKGSQE